MKIHKDRIECKCCKERILKGATKCRFCGEKQNKKKIGFHTLQLAMLISLLLLLPSLVFASIWLPKSNIFNRGVSNISDETKVVPPSFEESLLSEINKFRTENSRTPLESDSETCEIAERISGKVSPKTIVTKDYIDLCPTCNSVGMNLATDTSEVDGTFNSWKLDKITNKNMLADYKYGCVAKTNNLTALILTTKTVKVNKGVDSAGAIKVNNRGSQIDCIGPDGKQFKTTMDECKKLNEKWGKPVDYMTDCNIHPDCGGGTVRMSYSQCMKPCSGKANTNTPPAVVYVSTAPSANKSPVFLSYGGYTVYCPSQNVGAVISINSTMESKKSQWATNYNDCTKNFYATDSCSVGCKNTMDTDWKICTAAYGYTGTEYTSCTKEVSDNYGKCLLTCPSTATHCDYVYAEQKSLSSQITNLCK